MENKTLEALLAIDCKQDRIIQELVLLRNLIEARLPQMARRFPSSSQSPSQPKGLPPVAKEIFPHEEQEESSLHIPPFDPRTG